MKTSLKKEVFLFLIKKKKQDIQLLPLYNKIVLLSTTISISSSTSIVIILNGSCSSIWTSISA